MNAPTPLEKIRCARLPTERLANLAGLRRVEGISVLHDGDESWVFWENADERILRVLFPIEGVELFEEREGLWHRWRRHLPAFQVPDPSRAIGLDRAIVPAPFVPTEPGELTPVPSRLRLVRESRQRPSTAALCSLEALGRWAHLAPAHAIESLRGAIQGNRALILGRGLPVWPESTRYWGDRVLVPIGFQLRPNFAEKAILEILGASSLEVFRFLANDETKTPEPTEIAEVEAIPFDAFRPLTRAGIRIALRDRSS